MKLPWQNTNNNSEITIKHYPDGSSYAVIDGDFKSRFVFRIYNYDDLWGLSQVHDVYKHNNKTATVCIPWLIDGQADRRFDERQTYGLGLVLDFLKNMTNFNYEIYHPHNPEIVEHALENRVKILDNEFIVRYARTKTNVDEKNTVLMSTDAGGYKSLMKIANKIDWQGEVYSASKARVNGKIETVVDKEDFNGKDIIIVDDIFVYGGTIKNILKEIADRNVGDVYIVISHVTTNLYELDAAFVKYPVKKIIISDSLYSKEDINIYKCIGDNSHIVDVVTLYGDDGYKRKY